MSALLSEVAQLQNSLEVYETININYNNKLCRYV